MEPESGRLIFPGGHQEFKPFAKEMKKLQNKWAVEMSQQYRHVQPSARKWAWLADQIMDVLISEDTETAMAFILGLEHARDEAYMLAMQATQIMHKHGAVFYRPGVEATLDPRSFVNESQDIMAIRKRQWDEWVEGYDEYRRTHGEDPPPPF